LENRQTEIIAVVHQTNCTNPNKMEELPTFNDGEKVLLHVIT